METVFVKDGQRFDIHIPRTIDGVKYGHGAFEREAVREKHGVVAVEIEIPADVELYERRTYDTAPFVEYVRKSDEQIQALMLQRYEQALDEHLDKAAQEDRWSNRFTFVARAGYPNRWQQEAIAFGVWMDGCNEHAYALLQQVAAGEVPMPTLEEFIAGLPEYVK